MYHCHLINSLIYKVFLLLTGDQILFFSNSNTDSESEKMMNLLFLDSEMRSRAILVAQTSALNVEVSLGRCFFKNFSFM